MIVLIQYSVGARHELFSQPLKQRQAGLQELLPPININPHHQAVSLPVCSPPLRLVFVKTVELRTVMGHSRISLTA
jgi:hypothetical protein